MTGSNAVVTACGKSGRPYRPTGHIQNGAELLCASVDVQFCRRVLHSCREPRCPDRNLHLKQLNPNIDLVDFPVIMPDCVTAWEASNPRPFLHRKNSSKCCSEALRVYNDRQK
eukprot:6482697-Amphidinium_carterae.2